MMTISCAYTADGRYSCPNRSAIEPFYVAFAQPFDSPQIYQPADLSAALTSQGMSSTSRSASVVAVKQAQSSAATAQKAAAAQVARSRWPSAVSSSQPPI